MNPQFENEKDEPNPVELRTIEQSVPHWENTRGESMLLGAVAGVLVGLVCAIGLGWFTMASGIRFGLVFIIVGALIGFAVRISGNAWSSRFGFLAAILSLASCLAATSISFLGIAVSQNPGYGYTSTLIAHSGEIWAMVLDSIVSNPRTILFYAISVVAAFKTGFRD